MEIIFTVKVAAYPGLQISIGLVHLEWLCEPSSFSSVIATAYICVFMHTKNKNIVSSYSLCSTLKLSIFHTLNFQQWYVSQCSASSDLSAEDRKTTVWLIPSAKKARYCQFANSLFLCNLNAPTEGCGNIWSQSQAQKQVTNYFVFFSPAYNFDY